MRQRKAINENEKINSSNKPVHESDGKRNEKQQMKMKNSKVGVITPWWLIDNYGQLLQIWALQQFLKKMGLQPFLIRYSKTRARPFREKLLASLRCPRALYSYLRMKIMARLPTAKKRHYALARNRAFDRFLEQRIEKSRLIYHSKEELNRSEEMKCGAYVCGSDQVWNFPFSDSYNDVVFLNFGPERVKRIAYSASFGLSKLPNSLIAFAAPLIRKLDHVAVREKSGVELCRKMGREDTIHVVDPVLLLNPEDYRALAPEDVRDREYAFLYFIDDQTLEIDWSAVKARTQAQGLSEYFVPVENRSFSGFAFQDPTIEEWIRRIRNAKEAYTNSFHGACFCILFERPFLCFLRKGGKSNQKNERILSLMESLGLESRICDPQKPIDSQMDAPIDWKEVRNRLEHIRKQSCDFLNSALNSDRADSMH